MKHSRVIDLRKKARAVFETLDKKIKEKVSFSNLFRKVKKDYNLNKKKYV